MFREQFTNARDACALAEGIVDTVREPVLVLDHELRVIAANRSFYSSFEVVRESTQGELLYNLGDGQWSIPALRVLLEKILPEHGVMEDYEVDHDFPGIGRRTVLLNARKVFYEAGSQATILLGIEDVTKKRAVEHELEELARQKDIMLEEMRHRVSNSLQIIASIIMMKAKSVNSEEMRRHLQDAHQRVLSVAAVQQHLHAAAPGATIQLGAYLTKLCEALSRSMVGDNRSISLKVQGEDGSASCRDAESLGLIVTELIINSLKHAFNESTRDGQIRVAFDVSGTDWKLTVVDNGIGKPDGVFAQPKTGLGTAIIDALAKQLDAKVVTLSDSSGTTVSVTHATFTTNAAKIA